MSAFKTLLAILQSESDSPRVLDFAVPFAARHDSHLIGLHAESLPVAVTTPMGGPIVTYPIEIDEEAQRRSARLRKMLETKAAAEGVVAEWRGYESVSGDAAISGIESARSVDLVIAQQNDPEAEARMIADVEALIFEGGRPVLMLPYVHRGGASPFRRTIVAWNGTKEAARAAFDALPLLADGGSVEILTVDAQDTLHQDAGTAGAAIAQAMARHGLNVTTRAETSSGLGHGDVISNRLADTSADLLVMGAFGRSRLSEFIFGGVTRSMLQSMTTPTLMSR